MASQSQGIQQLLQAEKRAAEKVADARKSEPRGMQGRGVAAIRVLGETGLGPGGFYYDTRYGWVSEASTWLADWRGPIRVTTPRCVCAVSVPTVVLL